METLFPNLLTYSFFAPFILRLAIGGIFLCAAWKTWKENAPGGGRVASAVSAILGAALIIGIFTQLAALLGIAKVIGLAFQKKIPSVFHSKTFAILAIAILISLILTGAGAHAFDLPY